MATKKKAAKKKSGAKKKSATSAALVLRFDPRIKGDPPPPWLRQAVLTDALRRRQLETWVNGIVRKIGR
jgi:anti-sigma factor RsiW